MVRFLLVRHALWWLVGITGIALGLIIAGIMVDLRLCVLGLIAVCLCLPMAIAMVLIAQGLAPANALNTLMHRVTISAEGIKVDVMLPDESDSEEEKSAEKQIVIEADRLGVYTVIDGGIAVPVRSAGHAATKSDGVLILPYSAFESTELFRRAVTMLPKLSGPQLSGADSEPVSR